MLKRAYGPVVAFYACVLAGFTTPAEAGREVLVDQGDNYTLSGQNWPGDTDYVAGTTIGDTVPFALNFGSGSATRKFEFDPRGQVLFVDSSGTPTGDFLAPLFSTTAFQVDSTFSGFMRWGAGLIDPQLLAPPVPSPIYDVSNALQAFRFTWLSVCPTGGACDGSDSVSFQAVLINRGSGDFDLDFNYGGGVIPAGAVGGYTLGSNIASFSGPFTSPGPDYCFRGGVGALCSSISAVPEPATVALFLGGLGLLAGLRIRRRGSISAPLSI